MTVETPAPTPTRLKSDEKIMAALSHGLIILPFWGIIAAILIWVFQKDKSQYIRFQALQALVFHLVLVLAYVVGFACYMCTFFANFGLIFLLAGQNSSDAPPPFFFATFMLPFAAMGLILLMSLAFIVYGIVGAVMTAQGKDFRYVLIGNRVERFLQQDQQ